MTSARTGTRGRLAGAALPVVGALWSPRSGRATLHALAGSAIGLGSWSLLIVWAAAVWSLVEGPTGAGWLAVLYWSVAAAGPVLLPLGVQGLTALQRARLRGLLGIEIPPPPRDRRGPPSPIRPWSARTTWWQLGYHLLAMTLGTLGGALVAGCWAAVIIPIGYADGLWTGGPWPGAAATAPLLFLAAPWAALGLARADALAARALLGPGRVEELSRQVESLARSRADIVAATDAERRRIERDLHDGAQQRLVSLAMNLGMARAELGDTPGRAVAAIGQAHDEAVQALAELRGFIRGLHPAVLDDRGLDAALSGLAARAPYAVRLRVDVADRCSPSIEAVAYFVVSEALTNVAKHADAENAEVTVVRAGHRLRLVITDDGRGGATLDAAAGAGGLRGLAGRAAAVDGTLTLHSPAGGPTTITVELPCE